MMSESAANFQFKGPIGLLVSFSSSFFVELRVAPDSLAYTLSNLAPAPEARQRPTALFPRIVRLSRHVLKLHLAFTAMP
jgi:hypothetical protein